MARILIVAEISGYTIARLSIWLAILMAIVSIAFLFLKWLRARVTDTPPPSSEMMTNFREMYLQGKLSDSEYEEIKQRLVTKLQSEINEDEQSG